MGCCESTFLSETNPEKEQNQHNQNPPLSHPPPTPGEAKADGGGVPSFSEFSLADLKAATNNFSSDHIVSESGEKAPNLVYKGRLQSRRRIAVKKFTKMAWPDPKQFAVESQILPSSSLFLLLWSFFHVCGNLLSCGVHGWVCGNG